MARSRPSLTSVSKNRSLTSRNAASSVLDIGLEISTRAFSRPLSERSLACLSAFDRYDIAPSPIANPLCPFTPTLLLFCYPGFCFARGRPFRLCCCFVRFLGSQMIFSRFAPFERNHRFQPAGIELCRTLNETSWKRFLLLPLFQPILCGRKGMKQ